MIKLIEVKNYLCLRYVKQKLRPFQILVGPNASGKSAFLDVVALCRDILGEGLEEAITKTRAPDWRDLFWMHEGDDFEFAIEVEIPEDIRPVLKKSYDTCRYELKIGLLNNLGETGIISEHLWLKTETPADNTHITKALFPDPLLPPETIMKTPKRAPGWQAVVTKEPGRPQDYFNAETSGWINPFTLGPQKSALVNLPEDETKFPVGTWLKQFLKTGIQNLKLNSDVMRKPNPPGLKRDFRPDGSNLALVVKELIESSDNERFQDWLVHVRTALPDIKDIKSVEKPEDRHLYLKLVYETGLAVPSWLVSDGTLRMLALTLIPYLPDLTGVFLIEEPENGIHPRAIETVFQSLSSVYGAQVLLATHSPLILGMADLEDVLCFAKDVNGATDIIPGPAHPNLKNWARDVNLGTLFASGVLG